MRLRWLRSFPSYYKPYHNTASSVPGSPFFTAQTPPSPSTPRPPVGVRKNLTPTRMEPEERSPTETRVPEPNSEVTSAACTLAGGARQHELNRVTPPQALESLTNRGESAVQGMESQASPAQPSLAASLIQPSPSNPGELDSPGLATTELVSPHPSDWHSLISQARQPKRQEGSPPRIHTRPLQSGGKVEGENGKDRGGEDQLSPTLSAQAPKSTAPDAKSTSRRPQGSGGNSNTYSTPRQQRAARNRRRSDDRNPIVAPSPESGGVPEPSAAYLLRAATPPEPAGEPHPILVVIDLNGTLLHRPNRRESARFVPRPHASAFLSYCISTFYVVIWSSARERNVAAMCDVLLARPPVPGTAPAALRTHHNHRPVAVWGRDRFGLCPADYDRRVQCYKRLTRLWADPVVAASHPGAAARGAVWDQGNTVLIDDSAEKARSEPFNAVQIPEFGGDGDAEGESSILPQVHDYLNTLACQVDISRYIRAHPFKA